MILLTGFDPYGNNTTNLSSELVKKFRFNNNGFQIIKRIIPVSWKQSIKEYKNFLLKFNKKLSLVILLGIHSSKKIHLETLGWNFKIGLDNENKFKFGCIKMNYSPWIKTSLNLNQIYSYLEDKKLISISFFPGFYLCNYLYYWALYLSKKEYPVIFIHIPEKGDIFNYIKKVESILKSIIKIYF
ncbi:MAG: hypothetical protein JSV62_10135 [Promethearchaeota archaeon]|nr:MAG: hypothetical protein JSV62_10135 [Candidatus Lokiarchaeota archaeon]